MGVVVPAYDPLKVDGLGRPVDGPVGEEVAGEGILVMLHRQVELPGRDAVVPTVDSGTEVLAGVIRIADKSSTDLGRGFAVLLAWDMNSFLTHLV